MYERLKVNFQTNKKSVSFIFKLLLFKSNINTLLYFIIIPNTYFVFFLIRKKCASERYLLLKMCFSI